MTTTTSSTALSTTLAQAAQSIISGVTNSTTSTSDLVSAMVTAKTASQTTTLTNRQSTDNTTLSAIGQLKSTLSALQTALAGLSDGSAVSSFTAKADGTGLTATTSTGAVAGSYAIDVTQAATAQKLVSTQTGIQSTTQLGTGNLSISVGSGTAMTVAIGSGNNTLTGIASAINSAKDNPGVTATVVSGTDGSHLVLTSNNTGAANTIKVTTDSTDGLGSLAYDSASPNSNYTEKTPAQDAIFSVDGTPATSASNSVTGVITGVTLNLSAAANNSSQTLTVATDNSTATTAINAFVTAYNSYVTTASSLSSYDSTQSAGSQGGPLLGDSMLNSITSSLASTIAKGVSNGSTTVSLSAIGVDLQPDGTLKVDSDTLSSALTNNPSAVSTLFNSTTGVGAVLNNSITTFLQTGGVIDTRTTALNNDLADVATQQASLQTYTDQLTDQYNAQFTALNTLMAQMQSNSQYLTQLFGGEKSAGTLATNK